MDRLWFCLAGISGGLLGGMGMGGGTVLIPLLVIVLGVPQHLAQAVNLISFVPMAVVALIIHVKNRLIKRSGLWLIILSGLLSCTAGCFIARGINAELLRRIFGGFLTFLSVFQVCSAVKKTMRKG
ncbi:MAG: sulfite exporter TauE/SafE family protein [Clostridia bacterium]|nr:sulfite exporter TauE/SafE family protein [Clostridia bacterium]